jgi:hypothetical protein
MVSRTHLAFVLSLSLGLLGISCSNTHASVGLDSNALMQIVRSYNPKKLIAQSPATTKPAQPSKTTIDSLPTEVEYESPIRQAFSRSNFDELEKIVRDARQTKGRVVGGTWKLALYYEAIYKTFLTPDSTESDWKMHFDSLNKWIAAKPESAAARISLAKAYVDYAWVARGGGYAGTVSDRSWELFNERIGLAANTLADAAHLKEKCPYWYETTQRVALAQGWDKEQARELLEIAAASEPDYYHFYREYANYLQPKWYGEAGEVEAFADDAADRMGGPKGDILYFEISSLVACQCDAQDDAMQNMSWARIKRGYAALEQTYGVSSLKRNRFASMAVKEKDKEAAREALAEIGSDWDKDVWVSDAKFVNAKSWASLE